MFYFLAYVQEIGRGGRDGSPCTAMMYWAPADVSSNVPHMTQAMRDYVKSTECRRKFLIDHFGGPKADNDPDPRHCCDICSGSEEDSSDGEATTKYPACNKKVIQIIDCFLTQYFDTENTKIASPYPASISLLSPSLRKEISEAYTRFMSVENLMEKYPNLASEHCHNIVAIINSYVSSLN